MIRRKRSYERAGYVTTPFYHMHPPYHTRNAGHPLVGMFFPHMLTDYAYQEFYRYLRE